MIIGKVEDPQLRRAIELAAFPDEDVLWNALRGSLARRLGYPRLIVREATEPHDALVRVVATPGSLPELVVSSDPRRWPDTAPLLDRGAVARYRAHILRGPVRGTGRVRWVDDVFRDLSWVAARPLPISFRGFARRVLELPASYTDLGDVARVVGLSSGALKARFRRRGLRSPYEHLRWLRAIAAAEVLAERTVSVAQAAYRLGATSSGNLCRALSYVGGITPTALREPETRMWLIVEFAARYLGPDYQGAWSSLEEVFVTAA